MYQSGVETVWRHCANRGGRRYRYQHRYQDGAEHDVASENNDEYPLQRYSFELNVPGANLLEPGRVSGAPNDERLGREHNRHTERYHDQPSGIKNLVSQRVFARAHNISISGCDSVNDNDCSGKYVGYNSNSDRESVEEYTELVHSVSGCVGLLFRASDNAVLARERADGLLDLRLLVV